MLSPKEENMIVRSVFKCRRCGAEIVSKTIYLRHAMDPHTEQGVLMHICRSEPDRTICGLADFVGFGKKKT